MTSLSDALGRRGRTLLGLLERLTRIARDRGPLLLPFLFAILLAWSLPPLVWALWDGGSADRPAFPAPSTILTEHHSSLALLLQNDPFGRAPDTTANPAMAGGAVVSSNLSLELLGVAIPPNPRDSLALLGSGPNQVKLYRVGQVLPGGAKLVAVHPEEVIVDYQGMLEAIAFHHHSLGERTSGGPPTPFRPPPPSFTARLLSHPSNLLDYLRPIPDYQNGRFVGIRLYPGPNPVVFTHVGLRPGDVLTAVNGVKLTNPLEGYTLIERAATQRVPIVLDIQRNGIPLILSVPTISSP